ncbi:MAG: futalosine hydrolase [Bacteroidales bacterium]
MNILISAATKAELLPIFNVLKPERFSGGEFDNFSFRNHSIYMRITGIGLVQTTYLLAKELNRNKYDLVINTGIAGSYKKEISIGQVVMVAEEEFSDFGIVDENAFTTVFKAGLVNENQLPFRKGKLICEIPEYLKNKNLKPVKAICSDTVHGRNETIKKLVEQFNPDIETMEGAAFFYVCRMENVPFLQLRAISNFVESRNREKWNIPLALLNLQKEVKNILDEL